MGGLGRGCLGREVGSVGEVFNEPLKAKQPNLLQDQAVDFRPSQSCADAILCKDDVQESSACSLLPPADNKITEQTVRRSHSLLSWLLVVGFFPLATD